MLAGHYSQDVIAVKSGVYQVFIRYHDYAFASFVMPSRSEAALIVTTYAVICSGATQPAAARYFLFYLYIVFALCERKNDIQKKDKYRCA